MNVTWDNYGGHLHFKKVTVSDMERFMLQLQSLEAYAEHQENFSALGEIQSTQEKCLAAIGTAKLKGKKK